jgi:hypothetical protein
MKQLPGVRQAAGHFVFESNGASWKPDAEAIPGLNNYKNTL